MLKTILLVSFLLSGIFAIPLQNNNNNARPCDVPSQASLPFCNTKLSLEDRVKDLVSRLDVSEKYTQFSNDGVGIPRLSIAPIQWWGEALHGVADSPSVNFNGQVKCATSFPQVIGTGATFNKTLWHAIGTTISTEARAMSNLGQAGLTFWSPVINVARDPRWGRLQETPSEDPFHIATYASNFALGLQEGEDLSHIKVSSCCKHFIAYSLENWDGMDRYHFDADVTPRDLYDSYLPSFEGCVRDGRASSVMCSYNSVNGVPSCANRELLTAIVREAWGFQGYITSDCDAVDNVQSTHHYTNNSADTCQVTLQAGMDVDCGSYMDKTIKAAVESGVVAEALMDAALINQFSVRFRLGEFDPADSQPYMRYGIDKIATPDHQQLSLEASRQSLVMLENKDTTLPLHTAPRPTIALVGPHANATSALQASYAGHSCRLVSPYAGLEAYAESINFALGCPTVACDKSLDFDSAEKAARESDVTVMVMGLDQDQESEGKDRYNLTLPGHQTELIQRVAKASKGKVIVVLLSGGSVDVTSFKDKVDAIIWAGYPGEHGGQAIAEVIFGDYNPGGRLPTTWHSQDFVNQVSLFDMGMRPNASNNNPGRTYRFFTGVPIYEFGYGLSYTSFAYKTVLSKNAADFAKINAIAAAAPHNHLRGHSADAVVSEITVTVTNTGKVAGSDVVLVYAKPPGPPGTDGNPIKQLIAFERVFLQPGESTKVVFEILSSDLTVVSEDAIRGAVAGNWSFVVGEQDNVFTVAK